MWFFFVNSTLLKHKTQVRNNSTADDQKEKRKKLMSYSFMGRVELSTAQPCAGVLVFWCPLLLINLNQNMPRKDC